MSINPRITTTIVETTYPDDSKEVFDYDSNGNLVTRVVPTPSEDKNITVTQEAHYKTVLKKSKFLDIKCILKK